jgi:hypothetical protein
VDLKDATLMILTESGTHPGLAWIAQSAYDELASGREVPYPILSDMLEEASGKGVLRALQQRYSAAAYDAMLMPICEEIGRLSTAKFLWLWPTFRDGTGPACRVAS